MKMKLIIVLLIFIILASNGFWINRKNNTVIIQPETKITTTIVSDTINNTKNIGEQYLKNYISNFNNLAINDLPNFYDYRYIAEYNKNLIIVGLDQVIEYNPNKHEIIRTSDSKIINKISDGIVVGDYLYLATQTPDAFSEIGESSSLYKINLKTGVVLNHFFGSQTSKEKRRANPHLSSDNNTIWLSSFSGIDSLYVQSDYPTNYISNGYIKSMNLDLKSIYIKLINSNKTLEFSFKLPQFYATTPIINDIRYLISSDGLYALKNNEMPVKKLSYIFDDINNATYLNNMYTRQSISYLTANKQFFLLVSPTTHEDLGAEPVETRQYLSAILVDLENIKIYNLMDNPIFNKKIDNKARTSIDSLAQSIFSEENGKINVINKITNDILFSVNTKNNKLEF